MNWPLFFFGMYVFVAGATFERASMACPTNETRGVRLWYWSAAVALGALWPLTWPAAWVMSR